MFLKNTAAVAAVNREEPLSFEAYTYSSSVLLNGRAVPVQCCPLMAESNRSQLNRSCKQAKHVCFCFTLERACQCNSKQTCCEQL